MNMIETEKASASKEEDVRKPFLPKWSIKESQGISVSALIVLLTFGAVSTLTAYLLKIVQKKVEMLLIVLMQYTLLPTVCLGLAIVLKKDIWCKGKRIKLLCRGVAEFTMNVTWMYGMQNIPIGKFL